MAEQDRRRWAVLVATIWIQAFTGTNFDFSAYSTNLKSVLGISQVQLNYLAVASDMGKALGWSSGLALLKFPLWSVLLVAAGMGLVGYLVQWMLLVGYIELRYISVFLLCVLSGCSICWFNTVCFVLCMQNFSTTRPLSISLSVSFNGVSAALYTLIANAITSSASDPSLYLLLNAIIPLVTSLVALLPILRQPMSPPKPQAHHHDSLVFLILFSLAFLTGVYLLLLNFISYNHLIAWILLCGAFILLILPLFVPNILPAREDGTDNDDDVEGSDLNKGLLANNVDDQRNLACVWMFEKDRLTMLGEEHNPKKLIKRIDFWLYYVAYFCGGTIGLVYSNNLGQIAQSLEKASETSVLVSTYSACSFFGRLLSCAPDLLQGKVFFARTGWLAMALVPMPIAFFLLVEADAVLVGTALVGVSSGFIFAATVTVTSELFGPNSIGLNHNILITNIPLGSLLYGLLAAIIYDSNGNSSVAQALLGDGAVVCMGKKCYGATFMAWGCINFLGLISSIALFLRTRLAYKRSEH